MAKTPFQSRIVGEGGENPTQLLANPLNWRRHPKNQQDALEGMLRTVGWVQRVIVNKRTGHVVDGHLRVEVALRRNEPTVPVLYVDLTEEEEKVVLAAIDPIGGLAETDQDMLDDLLEGVETGDAELDAFLDSLRSESIEVLEEGLTDEDAVPEVPADPVTKLGDVWLLGRHRVMCGDATSIDAVERLMGGWKADFCFTSPPYNSGGCKGHKTDRLGGNGFYGEGYTDDRSSDEYIDFNRQIFGAMSAIAAERFSCCYNINYNKNSPSEYLDVAIAGRDYFPLVETIGWEKTMAISLQGDNLTRIFEFIFVYAKGGLKMNKGHTECERNLWKINNVGANHDIHKACFPVELVERGIGLFAPQNGVVFEPFGGSGTTLIAAEKLGRSAALMELDPRYCDVIIKRWQDFTGKQATLESTGKTFADVEAQREAEPQEA